MKINRLVGKSSKLKQDVDRNKFQNSEKKSSTLFSIKSLFLKTKKTREKVFGKENLPHSLVTKEDFNNNNNKNKSPNPSYMGSSLLLGKNLNFKNQSFFAALVKIDAFVGDTYIRSHFSQNSLVYASRNDQNIYDMHSSYAGLKRALQFLGKQKVSSLIFVGNPEYRSEECKAVFTKHNIRFFSSDQWVPGFISRNTKANNCILVIYDIYSNVGAKNEALSSNLPIVGFLTKYGNTDGLDYPVCINFENCGNWYSALWNTFFLKN